MNTILFLYLANLAVLLAVSVMGVYGVIGKRNIIKKVIALTILGDTVNTLAIFLGYRVKGNPLPPILPYLSPTREEIASFASRSVDPIPQALVITAIVINLAVTAFLLFLAVKIYEHYGTLDYQEIWRRMKK